MRCKLVRHGQMAQAGIIQARCQQVIGYLIENELPSGFCLFHGDVILPPCRAKRQHGIAAPPGGRLRWGGKPRLLGNWSPA